MSSSSSSSSSPHRSRGGSNSSSTGEDRPRFFDPKAKSKCWANADIVPGRHPERWRKDAAGNIVCKRFCNCQGCLCFEYDHIVPFSKGPNFFSFFELNASVPSGFVYLWDSYSGFFEFRAFVACTSFLSSIFEMGLCDLLQ